MRFKNIVQPAENRGVRRALTPKLPPTTRKTNKQDYDWSRLDTWKIMTGIDSEIKRKSKTFVR